MNSDSEIGSPSAAETPKREVVLRLLVATFDVYVRGVAEIAAELGLAGELSVETLMAYWLSLPEADNLVRDFVRGDLTMFSLGEETRRMVERDLGRLELEPANLLSAAQATTPLGKKLDASRREEAGASISRNKPSDLGKFIEGNPEILKQVAASSHDVLVMWVMLYLMYATKARERGHRVASEFTKQHPALRERIQAIAAQQVSANQQRQAHRQGPRLGPV